MSSSISLLPRVPTETLVAETQRKVSCGKYIILDRAEFQRDGFKAPSKGLVTLTAENISQYVFVRTTSLFSQQLPTFKIKVGSDQGLPSREDYDKLVQDARERQVEQRYDDMVAPPKGVEACRVFIGLCDKTVCAAQSGVYGVMVYKVVPYKESMDCNPFYQLVLEGVAQKRYPDSCRVEAGVGLGASCPEVVEV